MTDKYTELNSNLGGKIDTLNDATNPLATPPKSGSAILYHGKEATNLVYGAWKTGFYSYDSNVGGNPIAGYGGYVLTLRENNGEILKTAFSHSNRIYVMRQSSDGSNPSTWNQQ